MCLLWAAQNRLGSRLQPASRVVSTPAVGEALMGLLRGLGFNLYQCLQIDTISLFRYICISSINVGVINYYFGL